MSSTGAEARLEITRDEADLIAERWVSESASPQMPLTPRIHEFDLGYLVWGQPPPGSPPIVGAGRGIIDRETGELSVWPSLPIETIIEQFRAQRSDRPPAPRTWDAAQQIRRDLRRVVTPSTVSFLTLEDRMITARSVKGDVQPNHHPLVREFLDQIEIEHRERGYERCSEAAVLSDAFHAEDARRAGVEEHALTLDTARDDYLRTASLVTYRTREVADRVAGESCPPCVSCAMLTRHFGFRIELPADIGTTAPPVWRLGR